MYPLIIVPDMGELSYGYDAVGNITTITDNATFPGYPQTQTFTYDALDRLLSAQAAGGPAGDNGPESYGYDPDGELETEYRYTGQFEDGYINLYWYGSRWLDPVFGRFTTPDSIIHEVNNTLDWDLYQYVRSNPIKYLDPSGHRPCDLNLDELYDHGIWQPTLAERYKGQLQEKFGWKNIDNLSEPQLFYALQYQYAISNDSNLKPCTPIMPCLEPWSPSWSWDVNSKNPDYFALTITVGEGILGEIVIIFDRFGQIFVGPGGGVGVGTPISGSLTSGWIIPDFNPRTPAGPSIASNFLSGVYANASAGFLGGMGITFTTNGSNDTAFELGFFSPSATFSVGNLWQIR